MAVVFICRTLQEYVIYGFNRYYGVKISVVKYVKSMLLFLDNIFQLTIL